MNLRWRSAARGQHRAPRFAQQLSQNTGLPPETYAAAIICKRTATHAACAHHLASRHAHAGKKEKAEERVERAPIPNIRGTLKREDKGEDGRKDRIGDTLKASRLFTTGPWPARNEPSL